MAERDFNLEMTGEQVKDALQQLEDRVAEGWAVGEKDGTPVTSGSPYYENNAKYYAEQAGISAQAAADSAATAEQEVEDGIREGIAGAYVQESATPGAVVTFDDGADNIPLKDLKVNLAINQPLHGQANPYPAGGGANKWDEDWEAGGIAQSTGENTGVPDAIRSKGYISVTENTSYYMAMPSAVRAYLRFYDSSKVYLGSATAVQNIAPSAFTTPAGASYMRFYCTEATYGNDIAVNLPASVTTYSPYSNICPIYPVTEAEVSVNSGNAWDEQWELGGYNVNTGAPTASTTSIRAKNRFAVKPNTQYYFTFATIKYVLFYGFGGEYLGYHICNSANGYYLFTTPENAYSATFMLSDTYGATYRNNLSINYPATDTAYHAYKGQQYYANIGVNQWDEDWEVGTIDNSTGLPDTDANNIRSKNFCPCIAGTNYNIVSKDSKVVRYYFYDKDENFISGGATSGTNTIVTAPTGACYFKVRTTSSYGSTYLSDISVNFPARFTEYHAYTGNVVYGGDADITPGVLSSKYDMVDLGSLTWTYDSTNLLFKATMPSPVSPNVCFCSSYAYSPYTIGASRADKTINAGKPYFDSSNRAITVKDTTYTDPAVFKTAMAGVQLVYEPATPISIQLTPTEVDTLRGDNVIWADCGDITNCEYRADLKMYIDKVVGA